MTKPKYDNPRRKLHAAKKDSISIETTISERIAGYLSLMGSKLGGVNNH